MSRMGAESYSSAGQTQLSARIDEMLKTDFKDACDNQGRSMTEVIEELMTEFVDEHGTGQTSEGDHAEQLTTREREVYEECLRLVDFSEDGMIYQRRHARQIAENTKQVSTDELPDVMMLLRRKGFAAIGPMPYDIPSDNRDRWRSWRIKPECADPEQWKHSE